LFFVVLLASSSYRESKFQYKTNNSNNKQRDILTFQESKQFCKKWKQKILTTEHVFLEETGFMG
jgi:hypothetical protein